MKSLKIFFLTALVAVASMFTACTEDHEWSAGEQAQGAQVYFVDGVETNVTVEAETSSFEVTVMRGNVDEATTVPLKVAVSAAKVDEEADPINYAELFTVPSNVSFGAGKDSAKFTVSFDRASLEDGQTYTLTFSINDMGAITPYGYDKQTWTLVVPEPFVSLGKGKFIDSYFTEEYFEVEILQHQENKNLFRIMNPYTELMTTVEGITMNAGPDEYLDVQILVPGDVPGAYFGYDYENEKVTQEGLIFFPDTKTGWYHTTYEAEVYLCHPASGFFDAESDWVYNKVATYQDNGLPAVINIAPLYYMFGVGGWNYSTEPLIEIVFPGVELTDFSLELAYGGFRVAEDNATVYPIARAAYGADVAEIQYAFVAGDITKDAEALNAALNGIEDGSVVSNKVAVTIAGEDEETGEPILEMTLESVEGVEPGMFTVIAIPYSADGEAQYGDLAFTSFYVQGVGAGELPEVEFALYTMSLEDLEEATGDSEWIAAVKSQGVNSSNAVGVIMEGVDIKSINVMATLSSNIEPIKESFGSVEEYIAALIANGYDLSYDLEYIEKYGWDYNIFGGSYSPETSYTMFALVENTFGNVQLFSSSFTTEAAEATAKKGSANLRPAVMKGVSLHKELSSINSILYNVK